MDLVLQRLLVALLLLFATTATGESSKTEESAQPEANVENAKQAFQNKAHDRHDRFGSTNGVEVGDNSNDLEVIQLDSRNFGKHLSDGNVWLIEFYSPSCGHCVEFAPAYAEIARHYHAPENKSKKVRVGKINGQVERALVSRFNLYAYPSLFVVSGWSVYEFQEHRTKQHIMDFVETGHKRAEVISMFNSPMGPMGLLQGILISSGHAVSDVFFWAQKAFGLSQMMVGMLLFGACFFGMFIFIVFLAVTIPPRVKRD
jgi:thiol-disulfide isomerase/thioredoxin